VATWRIGDDLRVTYHDPRAEGGQVQDCGKPTRPDATLSDILAWAVSHADAGDVVVSPGGTFFVGARSRA
jgi:hypothetical protein